MARPSRKQSVAEPEAAQSAVDYTFTLGDRVFNVRPFAERPEEFAYDDEAEFEIEAIPIILKIMGLQDSVSGQESLAGIDEFDIVRLARDVKDILPRLVSIICNGDDREISEVDVKRMAKSPLNPELYKAVKLQLQADRLLEKVAEIRGTLSDLNTAAA